MGSRSCGKCGKTIPNWVRIDGELKNLRSRRFCIDCSPFGKHNTRDINKSKSIGISREIDTSNGFRICSLCKHLKPDSEYHRKNKTKLHSWCKSCLYAVQKRRWKDRKIDAINIKGGKCEICGYDKCINALEFHHIDSSTKEEGWNKTRQMNWNKIVKEIAKCQLLCANCHRETHWKIFEKTVDTPTAV